MNCKHCGKRFTVTSWTRNEDWRGYCPTCIIAGLEKLMTFLKGDELKAWNRPE